jgi:hypothetical protein
MPAQINKQVRNCLFRQFHTNHVMTLLDQPTEVQAFATQRHQYPAPPTWKEAIDVTQQRRVDLLEMKSGPAVTPAGKPSIAVYG